METNPVVQTLPHGSLILIADPNDVEQEDNGKVYVVHEDGPIFSFSMAGKEGLRGEQGPQGVQGFQGERGEKGIKETLVTEDLEVYKVHKVHKAFKV